MPEASISAIKNFLFISLLLRSFTAPRARRTISAQVALPRDRVGLESSKYWRVDRGKEINRAAAGTIQRQPLTRPIVAKHPQIPGSMLLPNDAAWMELALEQARLARQNGEVPVGAVVIRNGEIVGRAHNRNLLDNDPTAHAEILALRQAASRMGNHRLIDCTLFCTIEPCAMCAGAMIHARIARLVYGAGDPKAGAAGSVLEVLNHPRLNHQMQVTSGVLSEECSELLKEFFAHKRKQAAERPD